ncbi:MAG: hypothetical protein JW699_01375 [Chitinispirillaceae bacterium]|nr:hypothetical protein [Chitinispirillaceae bacterium]
MTSRRRPLPIFRCLLSALLAVSCAPTKPGVELLPERPVSVLRGDTLEYRISFADSAERYRFSDAFGRFVAEQRFSAERYDSSGVLTVIKILSLPAAAAPEELSAPAPAAETADTAPSPGGSLRLYYPRNCIEYPLAAFVDADPFDRRDSNDGYFTVASSSPAAVTLRLAHKTVNAAGKTLNALDIIELWTRWIRERPAEGAALFRSCDGIMKYLRGEEAIVPGFSAVDKNSIRIQFSPNDPQALERLQSGRLLPAAFKLGGYALAAVRGSDHLLRPNPAAAGNSFVNELTVRCGGDPNPLLSFSLGRYDGVLLWSAPDIAYGRTTLMKNSTCSPVGRDRYFVACALEDPSARAFVRAALSGRELLGSYVKAEGTPIGAVESDSAPQPAEAADPAPSPPAGDPVTILFRSDDPVSKIIAERLLAALARAGARGSLAGGGARAYEESLVSRSYGCAVGWAPETVVFDKSEKLRLASVFFGDEPDEGKRIRGNFEIPLFTVCWHLLAKNRVGLYRGKLDGIYVRRENR